LSCVKHTDCALPVSPCWLAPSGKLFVSASSARDSLRMEGVDSA
jgi:hypothetical protein